MDNRWQQIEQLYHAAKEQPHNQRAAFLQLRCGSDNALLQEVESLLASDAQVRGALDYPAWDGMESLLDAVIPADELGDAPLAVGTEIGPYRITGDLGAGGMGRVYRADDTRLGRAVAVKVSKVRFGNRFDREARVIAALNHPNICQLYDVGPKFLVMEFVEGTRLLGGYSLRETISIAVQIAEGLAAAHAAGVTHRDLKPDNILLTRAGHVKIVDFGLAKVAASHVARASAEPGAFTTEPGMVMGTVEYMSPEQVRGQEADHRSDIFSLGLIIYEMLAGRRAFAGESIAEIMTAILKQDPPELPASVPAPTRQIISRCLEKDPANRFQSAKDLAFALAQSRQTAAAAAPATTGEPADGSTLEPGLHSSTAARPFARRLRIASGIAVAAVAAAAVTALAIANRPEPLDSSPFRFTPVEVDAKGTHHPSWSPDGHSLAYFERTGRATQIVVRDLSRGTPPVALAEAQHGYPPLSWSPDGERIFYLDPAKGVVSISRAGGQPKVVLAASQGAQITYSLPALSPDGKTLAVLLRDRSQPEPVTRLAFSSPPGAEPRLAGDVLPCCGSWIAWNSDGDRVLVGNHSPTGASIYSVTPDGRQRLLQRVPGAGSFGMEFSAIPNSRFFVASRIVGDDAYGFLLIDSESGDILRLLPSHSPITSLSVSRSGFRIAYTSRNLYAQLYEIPISGGVPRPLAPSSLSQYDVSFSPRRNEFAFTQFGQLIVHDRDSSRERVLVSSQDFPNALYRPDLLWPAFSRAGDRVIFTCVGCEKNLSLWVAPVTGGTPARVAGDGNGGISASWSPDGAQIAYVRQSLSGESEAVRLRLGSGDEPERITSDRCLPSWSPAGDWILCTGSRIKLISPDGTQVRDLGETNGSSAWSNDGKRIYNTRRSGGREIIERVDAVTGKGERLTEFPPDGPLPTGNLSVSADGKFLAFASRAGNGDIWILDGFQPPRTLWERLWPRKQ